jgi:hypothetical protein
MHHRRCPCQPASPGGRTGSGSCSPVSMARSTARSCRLYAFPCSPLPQGTNLRPRRRRRRQCDAEQEKAVRQRRRQNWPFYAARPHRTRHRQAAPTRQGSARSTRPRLLGGRSPSVTAVASASRLTPGGSRRPPARRPERRHASSWSHWPTATCPEPGPAGPAPAADSVPAAPEAADPGRQHLKLIWSADAVANAKRTWPRHNSTSAGMHGTAIA